MGVGAALVLTVALLVGARGQSAAQRYIAGLRAKGEKLSYAELIRSRPRASGLAQTVISNNAPFLRSSSLEPAYLDYPDTRQPGRVTVLWRQPTPNPAATGGKPIPWAQFNEAIRQVQPHLREIREVLKRASPEWEIRIMRAGGPAPNFVPIRQATQWLGAAAMSELQQGRLEEALQDLEALAALANANRSSLSMGGEMIRVAVCGLGLSATWQALQAPGWSDAQLERMQMAWASLDLLAAVEEGLVAWRASAIEMWDTARKSSGTQLRAFISGRPLRGAPPARTWSTRAEECRDYVVVQSYRLTNLDRDEVFCLQAMQESLETIRAVQRGQPSVFQSYTTNALVLKLDPAGRTKEFPHLLSSLLMANSTRVVQAAMRSETLRQMTLAAVAIRRYQTNHHARPPNLEALFPEFLPQPTRDPMSGKALLYRPETNGDWLLYSTGEDATDDGGDPTPKAGGK
ncbi:MAG TPA: hypothetical protein VN829_13990, partial [Dongiaceae bacterium]|nr:hypothetical protein [Dongiaceae bacterium]